jgi:hypothetical protein
VALRVWPLRTERERGKNKLEICNEIVVMPGNWDQGIIVCDAVMPAWWFLTCVHGFFSRRCFEITAFWFVIYVPFRASHSCARTFSFSFFSLCIMRVTGLLGGFSLRCGAGIALQNSMEVDGT